jgi:glycosyltransferase involved in cell wall biosynthesis
VTRIAYTVEQCWHRVPGGTALSALGAASALSADTDIELIGVAAAHREPPPPAFRLPIPVRFLCLPRLALYEAWHTLRRPAVQKATGAVDVVHATGMAIPPRSAPLVVTVHDLAFVHHPGHATRNGRRFFERSLELTRRDADLVLCPSEATRRDCLAQGFDPERVRVVPWGIAPPSPRVDGRRDADEVDARLARYGLAGMRFVLFVGTIEPRKNLAGLVEAFRRLGRHDVLLAIAGPDGWNEDLRERLAPVLSRTRVLGFVPPEDLQLLYERAEVFCYPSLLEGFGMPVLEAMAAGAAVVTSSGTATEEVAGDAAITVDPHDPDAIASAIGELLDDPARRAHLGLAARRRACTFTWARTAALTKAAYETVAA